MGKLADELRKKFKSPREAIKTLGLDESLISRENIMATTAKPTKFAATALELVAHAVGPLLAKDQKVDLLPVFSGLKRSTFKKGDIKIALDAALKGKLAKDAEPGPVSAMLDRIEHMASPEVGDESVSEPQHNAMGAAAGGHSNLGIPEHVGKEFMKADKGKFDALPEFLKSKGLSEDDVKHVMDAFPMEATDESESEEERKMREEREKKAADEAAEKVREEERVKAADAMKGMVTKDEMNKAITAAVSADRASSRALTKALDDVRPIVGELAMTFDSAEQVYRHVAKMRKVADADTLPAAALPAIIGLLPKAGLRASDVPDIAQDADARSSFEKMYGADATRIQVTV